MLKIPGASDEVAPADISSFSCYATESENVWPPGTFLEMGKVFTEYADKYGYKVAEVFPVLGRNLSEKKKKQEAVTAV